MIESRLTYRFAYLSLVIFVFINIFLIPIYTNAYEWNRQMHYEFDTVGYLKANGFVLIICGIIFLRSANSRYKIVVNGEKLIVNKILSNQKIEFDLSEITKFEWHRVSGAMTMGRALTLAKTSNNVILLTFEDESELLISNFDYKNYEELRDFFYNYCKKNGLIKDTSGQIRRRKRMMGR